MTTPVDLSNDKLIQLNKRAKMPFQIRQLKEEKTNNGTIDIR